MGWLISGSMFFMLAILFPLLFNEMMDDEQGEE